MDTSYCFVASFGLCVHVLLLDPVRQWMDEAKESEIPELKAFAAKLFQDMDAVVAAMFMPYSRGQTEGRVNKLKLIKRSMYGRGKFDLLRQRVMYASAA